MTSPYSCTVLAPSDVAFATALNIRSTHSLCLALSLAWRSQMLPLHLPLMVSDDRPLVMLCLGAHKGAFASALSCRQRGTLGHALQQPSELLMFALASLPGTQKDSMSWQCCQSIK